jgi:hypothetical protein
MAGLRSIPAIVAAARREEAPEKAVGSVHFSTYPRRSTKRTAVRKANCTCERAKPRAGGRLPLRLRLCALD